MALDIFHETWHDSWSMVGKAIMFIGIALTLGLLFYIYVYIPWFGHYMGWR